MKQIKIYFNPNLKEKEVNEAIKLFGQDWLVWVNKNTWEKAIKEMKKVNYERNK